MARYSYKSVVFDIPEHINKRFVEEFDTEPDGDPNYDGDYWTLTAMWVEELQQTIKELKEKLEE